MNWPRPVRIIAVGSPRGDDSAGWEVVRALRAQSDLGPDIECHLLEGGQRILDVLDGRGSLILIDALEGAAGPGTIHRFDWPEERLEALRPGSTHDLRPAEALRLAEALGLLPPRVVVFGIEMETLARLPELSAPVAAAIPRLVRQVTEELKDVAAHVVASQAIVGDH